MKITYTALEIVKQSLKTDYIKVGYTNEMNEKNVHFYILWGSAGEANPQQAMDFATDLAIIAKAVDGLNDLDIEPIYGAEDKMIRTEKDAKTYERVLRFWVNNGNPDAFIDSVKMLRA